MRFSLGLANQRLHRFAQSTLNTLSDIFILILPMPLIKDLQIPKQQKISLMLVFALGML